MNPLFWPTLGLGGLGFWLGKRWHERAPQTRLIAWCVSLLAALPGILIALYYVKLLGEPLWLYRFRAIPGSEFSASGLGLLAGMLQASRSTWPRLNKATSALGIPVLFAFLLCMPHLKPVVRPLNLPDSPNPPTDGICRQSTPSTCGPASAVTLAHQAGVVLGEHDLARACYTSAGGTENWYLVRALRARGLHPEFAQLPANPDQLHFPAIAGVRLKYATGTGHFIPILGKSNGLYQIGDPMRGAETMTLAQLRERYHFTGFFLIVK